MVFSGLLAGYHPLPPTIYQGDSPRRENPRRRPHPATVPGRQLRGSDPALSSIRRRGRRRPRSASRCRRWPRTVRFSRSGVAEGTSSVRRPRSRRARNETAERGIRWIRPPIHVSAVGVLLAAALELSDEVIERTNALLALVSWPPAPRFLRCRGDLGSRGYQSTPGFDRSDSTTHADVLVVDRLDDRGVTLDAFNPGTPHRPWISVHGDDHRAIGINPADRSFGFSGDSLPSHGKYLPNPVDSRVSLTAQPPPLRCPAWGGIGVLFRRCGQNPFETVVRGYQILDAHRARPRRCPA